MHHSFGHFGGFGFRFPPFGLWGRGPGFFPRRKQYLEMLEKYKEELEAEMKYVEEEIEERKKEK